MITPDTARSSTWLEEVKQGILNKKGVLRGVDNLGTSITLEWMATDIKSKELAAFKKNTSEIASHGLSLSEIQFLKSCPDAVNEELFLKSCVPLFEKGIERVDWEMVKDKVQQTIRQFFEMDILSFGEAMIAPLLNDIYFFVNVKDDKSERLLGFLLCSITPALPYGNIKVINLEVSDKRRDLDKGLMSSIFKIIPSVKRLFLIVRPTNDGAIKNYTDWGFSFGDHLNQDPNHKVNTKYSVLMEYIADNSKQLQHAATFLDTI